MDTRNVAVTLEKAKEWYNSDNATLKEVALQAFTEQELKTTKFKDIKTFEQSVEALGLEHSNVVMNLVQFSSQGYGANTATHLKAIYKIDIICKSLNGDWQPDLVSGYVYYPWVRFFKANKVPESSKKDITNYFKYKGVKYALVGGDCEHCLVGFGPFCGGDGFCIASPGLFGCKSKDIALHMSKCFAKEIFLACFIGKVDDEVEWL